MYGFVHLKEFRSSSSHSSGCNDGYNEPKEVIVSRDAVANASGHWEAAKNALCGGPTHPLVHR